VEICAEFRDFALWIRPRCRSQSKASWND